VGTPGEPSPTRIGAAAVTFFALAATAPLAVLVTVVPAAYARDAGPLVPLTFLAITVVLLLFAATYATMIRRAPLAGAIYTYVSVGLGRPPGTAAAALAIGSYHALQLGLYGLAGHATAPLLRDWFGADVAWWTVAGPAGCWSRSPACSAPRSPADCSPCWCSLNWR
jgi:amino acid transporter